MVRLIYILITLLVISCTRDENVSFLNEKGTVKFTLASESRGTQDLNKFFEGDAIGVFALDPITQELWATNNKYIFKGGQFEPATESDNIVVTKGYDFDFYVYYPYSETQRSIDNIQYSVSDQADKSNWYAADFMTATHTDVITDYTIPLYFYRKNASVRVNVSKASGVTGAKIQNVCYSGGFNLRKNAGTVSDTRKDIQMYKLSESGDNITYIATLPVQTLIPNSNYIVLSGGSDVKLNSSRPIALEAGTIQDYSIEYQKEIRISDYPQGGTTTGAGYYNINATCTVSASPKAGYSFAGWYENGVLVNPSTSYSFTVTSNRTLEPKYRSYSAWTVNITAAPTEIPTKGGSSNITASASRQTFINGAQDGTESINYPSDNRLNVTSSDASNFIVEGTSVRVTENTTASTRTATITASCEGVTKSVTLTQKGREVTYTFTINNTVEVGELFKSEGGQKKYTIVSTKTITIDGVPMTENVTWTSSSCGFANITSDGTLTVLENNSKDERSCDLILKQNDSDKTLTIMIDQLGKNEIIIPPSR